jgi:uncharacterized protein YndB with AHSA1/START domain
MRDGIIERSGDKVTFRYERTLAHPVERVWQAITDPAQAQMWWGNRVEIDLRPGGDYITYHATGDRVVDRIVRLDPPTLLEHTFWFHVNPSALVTWRLRPDGGGCLLTLTHTLAMADVEAVAASTGGAMAPGGILARNGAGWHHLLDAVADALGGHSAPWPESERLALEDRYATQVG